MTKDRSGHIVVIYEFTSMSSANQEQNFFNYDREENTTQVYTNKLSNV